MASPPSPPLLIELRSLTFPYLDESQADQVIFSIQFTIEETDSAIPEVTFILTLNELLQQAPQSSPINPPMVYKFNGKSISFSHMTPENYYAKGTIKIVGMDPPAGQFMNDKLNFMFDINFGKIGDSQHDLIGVYPLTIN
jgi:hypothetical protein